MSALLPGKPRIVEVPDPHREDTFPSVCLTRTPERMAR